MHTLYKKIVIDFSFDNNQIFCCVAMYVCSVFEFLYVELPLSFPHVTDYCVWWNFLGLCSISSLYSLHGVSLDELVEQTL